MDIRKSVNTAVIPENVYDICAVLFDINMTLIDFLTTLFWSLSTPKNP